MFGSKLKYRKGARFVYEWKNQQCFGKMTRQLLGNAFFKYFLKKIPFTVNQHKQINIDMFGTSIQAAGYIFTFYFPVKYLWIIYFR
ncbi:MAG: hypothetical protein JWR02_580 [Mucilaginibacter sp.]|nr:hypothetical protein [Mucilaginibacter sp.]